MHVCVCVCMYSSIRVCMPTLKHQVGSLSVYACKVLCMYVYMYVCHPPFMYVVCLHAVFEASGGFSACVYVCMHVCMCVGSPNSVRLCKTVPLYIYIYV